MARLDGGCEIHQADPNDCSQVSAISQLENSQSRHRHDGSGRCGQAGCSASGWATKQTVNNAKVNGDKEGRMQGNPGAEPAPMWALFTINPLDHSPKKIRVSNTDLVKWVRVKRDGACRAPVEYGHCWGGLDEHHIDTRGSGGDDVVEKPDHPVQEAPQPGSRREDHQRRLRQQSHLPVWTNV